MDNKILEKTINKLNLSVATYNCLNRAKIRTVADILQTGERDLLRVRNFGKSNLSEVKEKLKSLGIDL